MNLEGYTRFKDAFPTNRNTEISDEDWYINTQLVRRNGDLYVDWIRILFGDVNEKDLYEASRNVLQRSDLLTADIFQLEELFNAPLYKVLKKYKNDSRFTADHFNIKHRKDVIKTRKPRPEESGGTGLADTIAAGLQNEFIQFYSLAKVLPKVQVTDELGNISHTKLHIEEYTNLAMNTVLHLSTSQIAKLRAFVTQCFEKNIHGNVDIVRGIKPESLLIMKRSDLTTAVLYTRFSTPLSVARDTIKCPIHNASLIDDNGNETRILKIEEARFKPLIRRLVALSLEESSFE